MKKNKPTKRQYKGWRRGSAVNAIKRAWKKRQLAKGTHR